MTPSFWKDKNVLITGHTGFKGSWLSLWLQSLGAKVTGYSLPPPTTPSLFELANVAEGMTSIKGDVCNLELLGNVFSESKPEIVIHMAAQSLVRYSYQNPVETYNTNVMGTVHVLEAVRTSGTVKAALIVTTDKCYQNKEWVWGYREDEPLGGYDPYSSSKSCAELVTGAYISSFFNVAQIEKHGVSVASARAGNVIGGGDWAEDRLVPDIMRAFMEKQPVIIRNPNSIRPWQHVLEPLNGYLSLVEHQWEKGAEFSGHWNFGPNEEEAKPVSWLVEKLTTLWGDEAKWELDNGQHPHEANYLKLDCSKAKTYLGWSPKLDLSTSLEWIIEWYRANQEHQNMRQITEEEIVRYQKQVLNGAL